MLKMRIFWKNTVKITSASGDSPPNPCVPRAAGSSAPDPRVVTFTYYYKCVEFISSVKCVLLTLKNEQNNSSTCCAFTSSTLI